MLAIDGSLRRGSFDVVAQLEAPAGSTVALLGPNGAGKSTLLSGIAGLVPWSDGRVVLGDRVLDDPAAGVRVPAADRNIGVVFQDLRLLPHQTVLGNVSYGLRARSIRRRVAENRVRRLLDELGIAALEHRRVATLSGGEAQRVALARALAFGPRLLLLDEPLSALDVRTRADARALLRRVLPTVEAPRVVVTHDAVEALALADRLVIMEAGRVVQSGTPDELRRFPRSPFVASLLGVNVLRGRLQRASSGITVLGRDGALEAASADAPEGADVLAVFAPSAVSLSAQRPQTSARNVLPATVTDITQVAGVVRVRLDARPALLADVTASSAASLHLAPGAAVFASVKATEIRVEVL